MDLTVVTVPQLDPRLGRQVVHDPASRGFPMALGIDQSQWRDKVVRIWDPIVTPNQLVGLCTLCDSAMGLNAQGNRVKGRVLRMDYAQHGYPIATRLDPFPGAYPPTDTGSSGLAAAKAAQRMEVGGEYQWGFQGVDEVVQAIVVEERTVGIGAWWYAGGFDPKPLKGKPGHFQIEMTGSRRGGHQWRAFGYDERRDMVLGKCWWGPSWARAGVFHIRRDHLGELLEDQGDAVWQQTTSAKSWKRAPLPS